MLARGDFRVTPAPVSRILTAMCCFSGPVRQVADTSIFCRMGEHGNQVVIYSMLVDSPTDVAMILPVPAKAGTREKDVRFLDFSAYPGFFLDVARLFPSSAPFGGGAAAGATSRGPAPKLAVQSVGSFEASFVPGVQDFPRLDERFRLPTGTWEKLPAYADYGFVVFKLKSGRAKVHPMSFAFPSRDTSRLFFPTVHIHDGKVHATATFDHQLLCQGRIAGAEKWEESTDLAWNSVKIDRSHGTVLAREHVYRHTLQGRFKNEDVWVPLRTTA